MRPSGEISLGVVMILFLTVASANAQRGRGAAVAPASRPSGPPPELRVVDKGLQNLQGDVIQLQGVNVPSLEYTVQGQNVLQSIAEAIDVWHAGIIRLPMSQDNWFGKFVPGRGQSAQTDEGAGYRDLIDKAVELCSSKHAYILLDLHWNDAGDWTRPAAQRYMPDEHSILFWQDVAKRYANNPAVFFDLYNEPHNISWDIWRNGGQIAEGGRGGAGPQGRPGTIAYKAVGLQTLLETVRATGAKNVVVAGGIDWSYDLRGIVNGYALDDKTGNGIMYATHIYPWKKNWNTNIGGALEKYCVFVGEVGAEAPGSSDQRAGDEDPYTWVPNVLGFIQKNHLSWTAWAFHASVHPFLYTDQRYTPSPHWGSFVRAALLGAQFEMTGPPR